MDTPPQFELSLTNNRLNMDEDPRNMKDLEAFFVEKEERMNLPDEDFHDYLLRMAVQRRYVHGNNRRGQQDR